MEQKKTLKYNNNFVKVFDESATNQDYYMAVKTHIENHFDDYQSNIEFANDLLNVLPITDSIQCILGTYTDIWGNDKKFTFHLFLE